MCVLSRCALVVGVSSDAELMESRARYVRSSLVLESPAVENGAVGVFLAVWELPMVR